jgi:kumamolisin
MKSAFWMFLSVFALSTSVAQADEQGIVTKQGFWHVPNSSLENAWDVGARFHTNHLLFSDRPEASVGKSPTGETPQSLRSVYLLPSSGGVGTIAIVDAYHYATALNDFNVFAHQFGLAQETSTNVTAGTNQVFQVVYANGVKPSVDAGWNQEEALDIEWAHAMAPKAKIVLVEAASSSLTDLYNAVLTAGSLYDVREVSMSWGGSEFSSEQYYDGYFTKSGVVYFAASGDVGGRVIYPGTSPNVVSAGATTINRNSSGAFVSETAWSDGGGGPSRYEARPSYQAAIATIVGRYRGTPDFSFDANPNSGVSVYDSTPESGYSGWMVFGGTSVASPSLAGIVNLALSNKANTSAELSLIYSNLGHSSDFRDIVSGTSGSYRAGPGWDFATGVGSNQGLLGK